MGMLRVRFEQPEVMPSEMTETIDGLAFINNEFDDDMKGWVLVHLHGECCSTQTAVIRCTYFRQFIAEGALQEASASYGGLTSAT